jgi:hypothetical protein
MDLGFHSLPAELGHTGRDAGGACVTEVRILARRNRRGHAAQVRADERASVDTLTCEDIDYPQRKCGLPNLSSYSCSGRSRKNLPCHSRYSSPLRSASSPPAAAARDANERAPSTSSRTAKASADISELAPFG